MIKNIKRINFLTMLLAMQSLLASSNSPMLDKLAQHTMDSQSGPDMESPHNVMFKHSAEDIYPEDDPIPRYFNAAYIRYFQPHDGSMVNGMYNKTTQTAQTTFHDYKNVIEIDGTKKVPQLTKESKYRNEKGQELDFIGIFDDYSENNGEKKLYYLFGTISLTKDKEKINNTPLFGYYTFTD